MNDAPMQASHPISDSRASFQTGNNDLEDPMLVVPSQTATVAQNLKGLELEPRKIDDCFGL